MSVKVYEIVTDRIIALLEKGVAPWRMPWSAGATEPKNLSSQKPYRGINVFLLGAQGYTSPYWATYRQITQELGGKVKGGSKGTPVVYFSSHTDKAVKTAPKTTPTPNAKATKAGDDGRYYFMRYYTVFNVAQCEFSDPSIVPDHAPNPPRHFERIEAAETIRQAYLARPGAPSLETGRARACYVPVADRIEMPDASAFEMREEFYSTLFHEMTHSTGAKTRLDRGLDTRFGSHDYTLEELVAECGAAFLCGKAGIDAATIENSAAYLAGWAKKLRSEPKWIVSAAAKAAKAADLILGIENKIEKEDAAA